MFAIVVEYNILMQCIIYITHLNNLWKIYDDNCNCENYIFIIIFSLINFISLFQFRRSIDLPAAHALISDAKLPREVSPDSYHLALIPDIVRGTFSGTVKVNVTWQSEANKVVLHAHPDLQIVHDSVKIRSINA